MSVTPTFLACSSRTAASNSLLRARGDEKPASANPGQQEDAATKPKPADAMADVRITTAL